MSQTLMACLRLDGTEQLSRAGDTMTLPPCVPRWWRRQLSVQRPFPPQDEVRGVSHAATFAKYGGRPKAPSAPTLLQQSTSKLRSRGTPKMASNGA